MSALSEIAAARARWADTMNAGSAAAFVQCVTDDAVWLPPRGDAVHGKDALEKWLSALFDRYDYDFATSDERVRLVGDGWAVEDARFRSALRPRSGEGGPMVHDGRYTVLWRRLESGEWRIDRYIDRTGESPRGGSDR